MEVKGITVKQMILRLQEESPNSIVVIADYNNCNEQTEPELNALEDIEALDTDYYNWEDELKTGKVVVLS